MGLPLVPETLEALYHHVERGLIRVDAVEVTYPLHIILRRRLERAMIEGELEVADLPDACNEGRRELLGVTPPDHATGRLQDIHRLAGAFGDFASYSLGALLAAQLLKAAEDAMPELDGRLRRGDFRPLLDRRRTHVHGRARSVSFEPLVEDATGAPLGGDAFLAHLDARYLAR